MPSQFKGFPQEALGFFKGLQRNNNREWFESQKQVFEKMVRSPMIQLVESINKSILSFAPQHVTDPRKAISKAVGSGLQPIFLK